MYEEVGTYYGHILETPMATSDFGPKFLEKEIRFSPYSEMDPFFPLPPVRRTR